MNMDSESDGAFVERMEADYTTTINANGGDAKRLFALARLSLPDAVAGTQGVLIKRLADAACFHYFGCDDGAGDGCGQLKPTMAALARAIGYSSDPATDAEIAAIPDPTMLTATVLSHQTETRDA